MAVLQRKLKIFADLFFCENLSRFPIHLPEHVDCNLCLLGGEIPREKMLKTITI